MRSKHFFKKFFKSFSYYFAVFLVILNGGILLPIPSASAKVNLPSGRDDEFGENNIVFYNPEQKEDDKCIEPVSGTLPSGSEITWIGDSYSVGAKSNIDSVFSGADYGPSVDDASSYIQVSKSMDTDSSGNPSGLTVLNSISEIRKYVVFALGTNDYGKSADSVKTAIDKVVEKAGEDKTIVLVTSYTKAKGAYTSVNDGLRKAKASHSNIIIADWAAVAKDEYYDSDGEGIHPFGHYDLWVNTIRDALSGGGGSKKCGCSDQGGAGKLTGDSLLEKIWNYIVDQNIAGFSDNPAAIAGALGNMWTETGGTFNPFVGNDGGCIGIIQWCPGSWNDDFFNTMKSKGFNAYYGKKVEDVDPQIVDDALYAELDILFGNLPHAGNVNNFVANLNVPTNQTGTAGARGYADLWLITVENAYGGEGVIEDPGVKAIEGSHHTWQGASSRREHAEDIFKTYGSGGGGSTEVVSGGDDSGESGGGSGTGISWSGGFITGGLGGYTKEVPGSGWSDETENRPFTTSGPNKILLHSTEGSTGGLAAYPSGNHYAAHFTLDAVNKKISQHYSINVASQAIKSVDQEGPIQIELVGFSQGHTDSKYSLFNWGDEEWDYVAVVLTAIAEQTGIPLTTSVDWASPSRLSSKEAFKSYSGILGHMPAWANDHVDPGNIWPMLSAALARNPDAKKFKGGGGGKNCPPSSGKLTAGGFSSVEEADSAIMAKYRAISPRSYGETTAGDNYLSSLNIPDTSCSTDLENCVAFSTWFINTYTSKSVSLPNGSDVVSSLVNNYGFEDLGTTPKVYSVFSTASGSTMCGSKPCGHTGVVLGINTDTKKIIIGEAGCGSGAAFTKAHEYNLNKFTGGNYTFAYTDVNI